ncbi:MAG: hypothetical protein MUF01_05300 [Bryobacterales bacterium]|nr:hypothetical protein [Bryobacterales bacterium]
MPLRAYLLLVLALTNSAWHACASEPVELPAVRKPHLDAWRGSTPTLDGVLSPGEYDDATHIHGVKGWVAQFSPTRVAADLSLEGFVKHDGQQLYFAFRITDDLLYGIDTPRWLPANNPLAHELSQKGFPWFGDEMVILLYASYRWMADESVAGDGGSWQMPPGVPTSDGFWTASNAARPSRWPLGRVMSSSGQFACSPAWRLRPVVSGRPHWATTRWA